METDMTDHELGASRVLLVRHAQPVILPDRPAGEWVLADQAAGSVRLLAKSLRGLNPDGVVASPEPKAFGTAYILAEDLGLPLGKDEALREQGRDTIPWIEGESRFRAAVANHFVRSDEAIFGSESSADAVSRFTAAVDRAWSEYRLPVVVTHGRIMCGYIGRVLDRDPMDFWVDLRMPDAFLLDSEAGTCARVEVGDRADFG
jgi:broad specificity phosphatase PhoE